MIQTHPTAQRTVRCIEVSKRREEMLTSCTRGFWEGGTLLEGGPLPVSVWGGAEIWQPELALLSACFLGPDTQGGRACICQFISANM